MRDYTKSDMRRIDEAYRMVLEAQGRANFFKNLTPEQAEELAKISPSYKSPQIWGATSNWICSIANKIVKYRKLPFEQVHEIARGYAQDISDFEKFAKRIRRDIGTIKSFEELREVMNGARDSGMTQTELSQSAKKDGRARQCYSLMKNGGDDFTITYEDGRWLIGYPHNFAYNSKFSSIGKWCHTGSFGDGEYYWSQYADRPVFYILDKQNGSVLCASYAGNLNGEVRNQSDNWPEGGKNWSEFFTSLGLKSPMVDNIERTVSSYEPPEEELTPPDVWDRVDFSLVDEMLFGDTNLHLELDNDDYGRGGGDFHFTMDLEKLSPEYDGDDSLHTRYAAGVDTSTYYTFDEFNEMVKLVDAAPRNNSGILFYIIRNVKWFSDMWENMRDMPSLTQKFTLKDDHTMSERISLNDLYNLYTGDDIRFGFDSRRKQNDIRKGLDSLSDRFRRQFIDNVQHAIPNKYGYIGFGCKNNRFIGREDSTYIEISIDADEADNLARRVYDGEFGDSSEVDILSLNMDGKKEFSVKRVDCEGSEFYYAVYNFIQWLKWICKTPKDLDGQIHFGFYGDKAYYGVGDRRMYDYPHSTTLY